ncbi:exo-beta-N-acetylmuramidase NamZ domain-containing protein [Maribacter sp. 2304DJ31-5]|uniref:exo-beta-N-acetylmuramidase NamZ family protein n=1 Tax=Maribacter sp. 2304DJ31-5 TaxID=3386273 RepID=UPI0039BCFDD3
MFFLFNFKSTVLLWFLVLASCGNPTRKIGTIPENMVSAKAKDSILKPVTAANRTALYLPLLKDKDIGMVANQTSVIFKNSEYEIQGADPEIKKEINYTHSVDSLLSLGIRIKKVFAPEHGFRGKADAGEKIKDGTDIKTGLPIISLYGKNRKPTQDQLTNLDVVLFDIQDVGVRFYTYIATLQLVMEACAEKRIPIIVLDRPNPNAHYVDGPTMETEHTGFLGMTEIPLVYGMTIGEYAQMINEEGWLKNSYKADLTIIPLKNWTYSTEYSLPIRPSPNLPNDIAINLYPSLGLFEGTTINAGRGTEFQFQRYGASFLDSTAYTFSYVPKPNFGSKHPKEEDKTCYGQNLSEIPKMNTVSLEWIIDAYQNCTDKTRFFNTKGFTKHAGTEKLQKQIEAGLSETEIKQTWQKDLEGFKKVRAKYLRYHNP